MRRDPREEAGWWGAGKGGKSQGGAGYQRGRAVTGGGGAHPAVTPVLRSVKLEETLDIIQSIFGRPTCLAHKVFKCLN